MGATQSDFRFGAFELNLAGEELRKNGIPVKLPPQPFRILGMLVSRAGQIVTREEIRREIWGGDTYVDFDHGMNQCIKQIRTALCDNTDHPIYVETLPRKGYRFLFPVSPGSAAESTVASSVPIQPSSAEPPKFQVISGNAPPSGNYGIGVGFATGAAVSALARDTLAESTNPPVLVPKANPGNRRRYLAAGAVALLAVSAIAVYWQLRVEKLSDKDTIVVTALTNYSSDPVMDDALNVALQVELEQTPFLNVLAPDKMRGVLKALNLPADTKVTPDLAREVCVRSNSKAVIAPSIADLGNGYRLGLTATDCGTGKQIASVETDAASRGEVVKTLGKAAAELRAKVGEPRSSLQQFNAPLEQASSSSLDALQAVARTRTLRQQHGEMAKIVSELEHAIELDPNYADAYLQLGISYLNIFETDLGSSNLKKAYDLRDRVTEKERLAIETFYHTLVTGDWNKSIAAFTQWTNIYPRDPTGFMDLSANLLPLGQYDRAAAAAQEALRLAPAAASYVNLMQAYSSLNRLEEAKAAFDEAQAHKVDDPLLYTQRYNLAFLQRDRQAMQQQVQWAANKPRQEAGFLCADARTSAFYGELREARTSAEKAVASAKQANTPRAAAKCLASAAQVEAEFGNAEQAKHLAAAALALSTERSVQTGAALALARAGDLTAAENMAASLSEKYPTDLMMQNYLLPTIRAAVSLQRNDPTKAVKALEVALPYERGFDYYGGFGALYPAYLRGEAFLKLGEAQPAAAEFQKMIDNPGIVLNFPTGAMSHLQIARAQAMMGDTSSASQSFQNFMNTWSNADPDIAMLKQARFEQQKLSRPVSSQAPR